MPPVAAAPPDGEAPDDEAAATDAPRAQARALTVDGNRLTLLPDGPERLEALLALIDGAQHSLRLLYYIYPRRPSGERVRDALIGRSTAASRSRC